MPDHHEPFSPPPKMKAVQLFPFKDQDFTITLYTMFLIFKKMRHELGLEAMLEYMDYYQTIIEHYNPLFQQAVRQALDRVSVHKIYANAVKRRGMDDQANI